jgi:hypothetical protein
MQPFMSYQYGDDHKKLDNDEEKLWIEKLLNIRSEN